jgi:hypothetical protein
MSFLTCDNNGQARGETEEKKVGATPDSRLIERSIKKFTSRRMSLVVN